MTAPLREIPGGFREFALAHKVKETLDHYKMGARTFRSWCTALGILDNIQARDPSRPSRKVVPDDFHIHGKAETNTQLQDRYGASKDMISRWRKQSAVAPKVRRQSMLHPPEDFRSIAPTLYRYEAAKHFGVCDSTLTKWSAATGVKFRPWKARRRDLPATVAPQADASVEGRAAQHLRKYMPVYRANTVRPGDDGYVVGNRKLSSNEMMAFATAKGFSSEQRGVM